MSMASAVSPRLLERVIEVTGPVEAVDVTRLLGHLLADAAVHEHPAPRRLDEQRAHRQLDPMPVVGGRQRLPQRARHHAEHRPAVEPERAVVQDADLHVADRQRDG